MRHEIMTMEQKSGSLHLLVTSPSVLPLTNSIAAFSLVSQGHRTWPSYSLPSEALERPIPSYLRKPLLRLQPPFKLNWETADRTCNRYGTQLYLLEDPGHRLSQSASHTVNGA
jgi:hypothetical protein